jgi:hypothetical protein
LKGCASASTPFPQVVGLAWPSRPPDLKLLHFFLRRFVKLRVLVPLMAANVLELRTRIIATVAEVTPKLLRSVWQEIAYRRHVCRITSETHAEPYLSRWNLLFFCYIMTVQNTYMYSE